MILMVVLGDGLMGGGDMVYDVSLSLVMYLKRHALQTCFVFDDILRILDAALLV